MMTGKLWDFSLVYQMYSCLTHYMQQYYVANCELISCTLL